MVCVDFEPNSASSGSRKLSKKSSTNASARRTVSRISAFTSVVNATGRSPAGRGALLMRSTHARALSIESTKGMVSWVDSTPSNWVSRLWPSISTVMPVPSETKNTVRRRSGMKCKIAVSTRSFNRKRRTVMAGLKYVVNFDRLGMTDVEQGGLDGRIAARLKALDPDDVAALARCGEEIRRWIEAAEFPKQLQADIA